MTKDDKAPAVAGATLAEQHDARVLAIALVIKLMGEGKRALADQVLSLERAWHRARRPTPSPSIAGLTT